MGTDLAWLMFYAALAAALAGILVLYVALRVLVGCCSPPAAGILDHHVIRVFIQLFVLLQYALAMTSLFAMREVLTHSHAIGDFGLALLVLVLGCGGTILFGFLKIARHRDLVTAFATATEDAEDDARTHARAFRQPFHLRYSVFYRDVTVDHVFYFLVPLVVDIASGAIVALLPSAMIQLGALLLLHAVFILLVLLRQPFAHTLAAVVTLVAAFVRMIILFCALGEAHETNLPKPARDTIGVIILSMSVVFLILLVLVQLGVIVRAIIRFITAEPLEEEQSQLHASIMDHDMSVPNKRHATPKTEATPMSEVGSEAAAPTPARGFPSLDFRSMSNAEDRESEDARERQSSSTQGARRLYAPRRPRRYRRVEFAPVDDSELPEWARV